MCIWSDVVIVIVLHSNIYICVFELEDDRVFLIHLTDSAEPQRV